VLCILPPRDRSIHGPKKEGEKGEGGYRGKERERERERRQLSPEDASEGPVTMTFTPGKVRDWARSHEFSSRKTSVVLSQCIQGPRGDKESLQKTEKLIIQAEVHSQELPQQFTPNALW
jgi:hypothetical protein